MRKDYVLGLDQIDNVCEANLSRLEGHRRLYQNE